MQAKFDFPSADRQAVERLIQLGRALRDTGDNDADMCLLMRLVFDQTLMGIGPPWIPNGDLNLFLGHAWGPRCRRDKFYRMVNRLQQEGILLRQESFNQAGRVGFAYRVNWHGVYFLRGLPLPEYLLSRAIGESSFRTKQSSDQTGVSSFTTAEGPIHSAPLIGTARNLSSVLSTDDVDVDSKFSWKKAVNCFNEAKAKLFRSPFAKLSNWDHEFLLCCVVLSMKKFGREWFQFAVDETARRTNCKKLAYLRGTLANRLDEFLDICQGESPRKILNQEVRKIMPDVRKYLAEHPLPQEPQQIPERPEESNKEGTPDTFKAALESDSSGTGKKFLKMKEAKEKIRDHGSS
jgi:hypothetical protein